MTVPTANAPLDVDTYLKVRTAVQIEGLSKRAAARRFGIDPKTVAKMMSFSVPPGYVRTRPPVRPKLDAFVGILRVELGRACVRAATISGATQLRPR